MVASWLADQLDLPLVTLDLAAILSSLLGSTGRNVKSALDYAKSGSCVLLLDEFDALAKRREDDTDVGELKRIVNVILIERDRWPETSLLVAATNHPQLLDPAVGRRFDLGIELPLPSHAERRRLWKSVLADVGDEELVALISSTTEGASGSDIVRLGNTLKRRSVLDRVPLNETAIRYLAEQAHQPGPERDGLWLAMCETLQLSNRQIGNLVGKSHPTVGSALKRARSAR